MLRFLAIAVPPTAPGADRGLDITDLLTQVALVVGGAWALYLYWASRQGQATVAVQPTVRLHEEHGRESAVLLVSLRIVNASRVLFRYESATAILMDASGLASDGSVLLLPFAEQNPFLPVYGQTTDDPLAIEDARLFEIDPNEKISLEPSEVVDTELAYPVEASRLGLMAMLVRVQGYQRRWGRQPYVWSSFFFIDPRQLGPSRVGHPQAEHQGRRGGVSV